MFVFRRSLLAAQLQFLTAHLNLLSSHCQTAPVSGHLRINLFLFFARGVKTEPPPRGTPCPQWPQPLRESPGAALHRRPGRRQPPNNSEVGQGWDEIPPTMAEIDRATPFISKRFLQASDAKASSGW